MGEEKVSPRDPRLRGEKTTGLGAGGAYREGPLTGGTPVTHTNRGTGTAAYCLARTVNKNPEAQTPGPMQTENEAISNKREAERGGISMTGQEDHGRPEGMKEKGRESETNPLLEPSPRKSKKGRE